MTTVIGGSSPSITFSDSTTQSTAALPLTGGSVSADITVHGLTVGLGASSVYTNMAFGANALGSNTTGNQNTALGGFNGYVYALGANTSGSSNTAVGSGVLGSNTTGSNNSAFGQGVMNYNTTGGSNVAVGGQALYSNTTASNNTAVGYQASYYSTGGANTSLGTSAGYGDATGASNVWIGYYAGPNTVTNASGTQNTAVGRQALYSNTTASNNTAVGYQAGYSASTSSGNVFVGEQAGYNATGNGYSTCIGQQAGYNITTGHDNICIGASAGTDAVKNLTSDTNTVVVGYNGISSAYIKVSWTVTSDARDKTNINPVTNGLAFVNQLKPISYQFTNNRTDMTPTGRVRNGFLAQDILALEGDNPIIIDNADAENLKYNGESLVPILVKAIQDLNTIVTSQATEIAALKAKVGI